jgi:hypothetical protein
VVGHNPRFGLAFGPFPAKKFEYSASMARVLGFNLIKPHNTSTWALMNNLQINKINKNSPREWLAGLPESLFWREINKRSYLINLDFVGWQILISYLDVPALQGPFKTYT